MIIGSDIDGVVANLCRVMVDRLNIEGHKANEDDFHTFHVEDVYPVADDWIVKHFDDRSFWMDCIPYKESWFALNKWWAEGDDIYFVTCRSSKIARKATHDWLEKWEIPYNDVVFTSHMEKMHVVNDLNLDFFMEDRFDEAAAIAEAGHSSFLIDRPYNQGDTPAIRVANMAEIDEEYKRAGFFSGN